MRLNAIINYQKLEIGPSVSAAPSRIRANYRGVFVINTKEETSLDSGPMFAHEDEQEAIRWMRLINYIRILNNTKVAHPHPLTPASAVLKVVDVGPTTLKIDSKIKCSTCKSTIGDKLGYICEFCDKYQQCKACFKACYNTNSPLVDTPHHNHPLMKVPAPIDKRWIYEQSFTCSRCSKNFSFPADGYHCVECEGWTECGDCVNASKAANTNEANANMALDLKFLTPAMKVDGNKYALNSFKANKCPEAASIITSKPWNLSNIDAKPADHAYFEVTFNKFNKNGHVCVGIGNQIFGQNQLLGYQQNSFGYVSNGKAVQNIGTNPQQLEKYEAGVTVGCGVLVDSYNHRRVYYTKEGQIVGVFEGTLHRGMDCFPGVSFTRSAMPEFVVNFEGPFKFDVKTIPNYRNDKVNRIEALPAEILSMCLAHASTSIAFAGQLCQVSKAFSIAARSNEVWKPMFLRNWPLQYSKLKVKSWWKMYQRREQAESNFGNRKPGPKQHFIENCDMEFECPLIYENLQKVDAGTRHCSKCDKTVYEVSDEMELHKYAELGRCVTFVEKVKPNIGPEREFRRLMGSRRAPPPKIPPPFQK